MFHVKQYVVVLKDLVLYLVLYIKIIYIIRHENDRDSLKLFVGRGINIFILIEKSVSRETIYWGSVYNQTHHIGVDFNSLDCFIRRCHLFGLQSF